MENKELESLTIGEAKTRQDTALSEYLELSEIFGRDAVLPNSSSGESLTNNAIGKYVIIRSRNEGINAGVLVMADNTGVVLDEARRLWYHKPAVKSESWYEGVANHGLGDGTKISGTVGRKIIIEDYSITVCTDKAKTSISGATPHAQN